MILSVEVAGSGPPVVFLHAGIADRRMWRHQVATLAARYQVIAFDRRGFGETPAVDEAFSQTGDLLAVLDQFVGRRPVILVGCSQGGMIAIDAALAAPDRIAGLVLVSPSISGSPTPIPIERVRTLNAAIDLAAKAGDLGEVNRLKASLFLDGALAEEGRVTGPARDLFLTMNAIVLAAPALGRPVQPAPAWDRVGRITQPVRILCGDLDIPHIQDRCCQLATLLPDATFELLPDAAHLPSLEQPEAFTRRLSSLLADLAEAALPFPSASA